MALPAHQRQRIAHCDPHLIPPRIGFAAGIENLQQGFCSSAKLLAASRNQSQSALSESSQQIAQQKNQQYCAKPDACPTADAPPAVAVVSSASAKYENQNNYEYDEHFLLSF
jgi:hypothetical protein